MKRNRSLLASGLLVALLGALPASAAEKGLVAIAYERKHGEYSRIHQLALNYVVALLTYRSIEEPMIALGRQLLAARRGVTASPLVQLARTPEG